MLENKAFLYLLLYCFYAFLIRRLQVRVLSGVVYNACIVAVWLIGSLGVSFADTNKTSNFGGFITPNFAMPKLINGSVPKLCQDDRYAVVYSNGQKTRLGKWDKSSDQPTESALKSYARFVAEWVVAPFSAGRSCQDGVTINELARAFLNEKRETVLRNDYVSYEIALATVLQLYDEVPADLFSPKSLKAVRNRACVRFTGKRIVSGRWERSIDKK